MNRFHDIRFLKSVKNHEELGDCQAEVAFIGRSNVGKSTILNVICGKKELAITSQTSGRTRAINVFLIRKHKWLVDLPGYGYARGPRADQDKFKEMVEGYLLNRETLRLVVMIVDGNVGATRLDEQTAIWLKYNEIPFLVVANKCDKLGPSKHGDNHQAVADTLGITREDVRWVSAERGIGMGALANEIADVLEL